MSSHFSAAHRCMTVILSAILVVASLSFSGCALQSLIPNTDKKSDNTVLLPDDTQKNQSPNNPVSDDEKNEDNPKTLRYVNPLTGAACEMDLSLCRPVFVCMGGSEDDATQYGIGTAEILVEAPIESGETRLAVLTNTYAGMPKIGAVRATRSYFNALAKAYGAIPVCAGTSDVRSTAASPAGTALDYRTDGLSTVFFRDADNPASDSLFTSGTRLVGAMENYPVSEHTLPYLFLEAGRVQVPGERAASGVVIPYSAKQVTQFVYNRTAQTYTRLQNSVPHTDPETQKVLSYTNLIILVCESSIYNKVTGTEYELNTSGSGTGYYISCGGSMEILWSYDADGQLQLTDKTGTKLTVNRGKTYIGLVDLLSSSSVLIVE